MRSWRAPTWIWSFAGALGMLVLAVILSQGRGAGVMLTTSLSLAVFMVIAGLAQMFVITLGPGNIDLSIAANMGLSSAVAMTVMNGENAGVALGLLAALGCGLGAGLANYLLIRALRIPPIIATLSASFIIQSLDIGYGRGLQIKPPVGLADFTNLQVAGLPVLAVATILLSILAGVVLYRTIHGRAVLAVGQNARAARLAGLDVEQARAMTYALSGLLAGLNGALLAGYFGGASVDIGNEYLLLSIAIVVLGGTAVAGGKAQPAGLWGAALFLTLLLTVLNMFSLGAGLRMVLTGVAILAVISIVRTDS